MESTSHSMESSSTSRIKDNEKPEITLQVPARAQPLLVGTGRRVVSQIESECDVRIIIPSRREESTTIAIYGKHDASLLAQSKIENLLGYKLGNDELTLAYLDVPKPEHGALIGIAGSLLKELRRQCGCHIHVPRHRERQSNVEVHGSLQSIAAAKTEIERILKHKVTLSYPGPNDDDDDENGDRAADNQIGVSASNDMVTTSYASSNAFSGVNVKSSKLRKRNLAKGKVNEILFLPDELPSTSYISRICLYIQSASKSVDLCLTSIEDLELLNTFTTLLSQGITVRIVLGKASAEQVATVKPLQLQGALLKVDQSNLQMCSNFAVIDGALVINSTFAWAATIQAEARRDNLVITNHRDFVSSFHMEFEKLWKTPTFADLHHQL